MLDSVIISPCSKMHMVPVVRTKSLATSLLADNSIASYTLQIV